MYKSRFYSDFFNFDSLYKEVESLFNAFQIPQIDTDKLLKEEEVFDKGEYDLIVEKWKDEDGKVMYSKKEVRPKGWEKRLEIADLKKQLAQAVKDEKFEDAAKLRDQIKQLDESKQQKELSE